MISLRDFQLSCVNQLDSMTSACLVAATGSGKTMMGAALSWRDVSRGGRVAFVVPRDNLARQTAGTLRRWGLNAGYILGGEKENRSAKVQILSYQSLGSKTRSLDWLAIQTSLWIIDEAHITAFAQSLAEPLSKAKRKIGLTATPWQMGGKRSLLDIFAQPVFAPTPGELIKRGYLAQPIYFRPKRKGKLNATADFIYQQWNKYSPGEKTFVFCGSIAESDACAKFFQENGISAVSVTSKTPTALVEPTFDRFRDGEVRVLVSCNKLAEGCDIPDATCVILANRTESMSGAIQRMGRGARIAPGKSYFKIIDCVGITKKFGRLEEITVTEADFDLDEPSGEGKFPEKQCGECDAWNHLSAKRCHHCQAPFDVVGAKYEDPGELERLTSGDKEAREIAAFHAMLLEDFRQGRENCERRFFKDFGYYPPDHWVLDAPLPEAMQSRAVNAAWGIFKRKVGDRLPKGNVQLVLPGLTW